MSAAIIILIVGVCFMSVAAIAGLWMLKPDLFANLFRKKSDAPSPPGGGGDAPAQDGPVPPSSPKGGGGAAPGTFADSGGTGWKKATATWYTSYPACCDDKSADQTECRDYNGCKWAGMFAAFEGKKPRDWIQNNNIVAFYDNSDKSNKQWDSKYKNKKIRIRNPKNGKAMDVTVVDQCGNSDCSGCCSKNAEKNGGFLIDLESNTAKRFYAPGKVEDLTAIEWKFL